MKGFPLGNLHFIIALGMALAGGVMGLVNKTNKKWGLIPAAIAGVTGCHVLGEPVPRVGCGFGKS